MGLRAVLALGGNALGNTPEEQIKKIDRAVESIVDMIGEGYEVILTHGNGPQVGMINLAFDEISKKDKKVPHMPLPECTAMSQGYIGYHLQNGIQYGIDKKSLEWKTASIITQVEVEKNDPSFLNPSKPIGGYYTKEEVENLKKENPKAIYMKDSGRGYRKVVASPKPVNILGKDVILTLIKNKFIVIACGGGGIPVVKNEDGKYCGVDAVIDKDFASAKLADLVDAHYFVMLTSVDKVFLNFNKDNQHSIDAMSADEAQKYCLEGHFAKGSMLPKVQSAINFVKTNEKRKAFICSLENLTDSINGKSGTIITNTKEKII